MLDQHRGSAHEAKYQWMLDLFTDVESNKTMRPEAAPDPTDEEGACEREHAHRWRGVQAS